MYDDGMISSYLYYKYSGCCYFHRISKYKKGNVEYKVCIFYRYVLISLIKCTDNTYIAYFGFSF